MNINLIYQGNNYNFDLRKDINIKYIHDLASKLISKDISTFELFYKMKNLSNYEDSTLLKDLAEDDNNISIIISPKQSINFTRNENNKKLKKLKDLKIILTTPPIVSPIDSKNKNNNTKMNLSKNKKSNKTLEYISENKVFEDIYNSKENEIISLMNNLSQKIKEYDNVLYKKYKNNSEKGNNEISLYEKNIIDFKNNQIRFLKKLIDYFITSEKDFIQGSLPLADFYINLKQYNNPKIVDVNNNNFNKKKVNKKINNNKNKNNYSSYETNFKELPLLIDNKAKKNKYILSNNNNTIRSDNINESNSDFEDDKKNRNNQNISIINNYKDILNKDKINKSKKDNNNTNISNSTSVQGKNAKANVTNVTITNKKRESKNNNLLIKSKSNQQSKRLNTFLKNKDNDKNKNKINALFEESPNKQENISNNNDESSELSHNSSKKRFSKDSNKDLTRMQEERLNTLKSNKYSKKGINKYKKIIRSNIYDFII